ncbi:MAG: helix-turn-helix domain-containing protein [bacterium]|nr:helix-turn-helix domain-containing protein [bacterium]
MLKLIRKKHHLTLEKTAARFIISKQTLSRYENGDRTPDNEFIEEFGRHFDLSGDWLIYGEPPIFKTDLSKDIEGLFLELSASLKDTDREPPPEPMPGLIKISLENLTGDSPDNFIQLLHYMLKDRELRRDIFSFFHLITKPRSDRRESEIRKGKKSAL